MAAPSPPDGTFDPDARLVNISCFDLLLIELIPLAERMARAYEASLDRPVPPVSSGRTSKRASRGGGPTPSTTNTNTSMTTTTTTTSAAGAGAGAPAITITNPNATLTSDTAALSLTPGPTLIASDGLPATPIFADSVYVRLERLGFRVGEGLSERFSRDRPRFQNYAGSGPGMAGAGSGGSGTGAGGAPTVGIGNINDHHLDVIKFLCKDIWTVVWKKQVDNLKTNHRV
jgi:hypothetical protein